MRICACRSGGELVDHPIDRRRGGRRVQRAEHQVSRLRRLDGNRNGLEIPQLADQHDVRIFAQRRPQRVLERIGVRVHFALIDQALLVFVHELDRVLDRDDVILPRLVDVIDHRAERRRLPRSGRSGDQHQALVQLAQVQDERRQPELLGGEDLRRDDAEHRAPPLAIGEDVCPEARQPRNFVREVGIVMLLELRPVVRRHDGIEQAPHDVVRQHRNRFVEPDHAAVLADERRRADGEMQIRRTGGTHRVEQSIDRRGALTASVGLMIRSRTTRRCVRR